MLFCVQFMVSVTFRFVPAAHIFHIGSVQRVYPSWAEGNFCTQNRVWRPWWSRFRCVVESIICIVVEGSNLKETAAGSNTTGI